MPGATAYGRSRARAAGAVQAVAERLIADRLENGEAESAAPKLDVRFPAVSPNAETAAAMAEANIRTKLHHYGTFRELRGKV